MGIFNFLRQMPEKITDANTLSQVNIFCYYVAESASGPDKANSVFRLATRAGIMGPCCQLGISRVYWLNIGLVRFCVFIDLDFVQVNKNAKKTWPISSHLDLTLGQ